MAFPSVRMSASHEAELRAAEWYYSDGDSSEGPHPLATLSKLYVAGKIDEATFVWREVEPAIDWLPLKDPVHAQLLNMLSLHREVNRDQSMFQGGLVKSGEDRFTIDVRTGEQVFIEQGSNRKYRLGEDGVKKYDDEKKKKVYGGGGSWNTAPVQTDANKGAVMAGQGARRGV